MIKLNESRRLDGWQKDPDDARDYPVADLLSFRGEVALPDKFQVVKEPVIFDQGGTSCCVACSAAGVKTDQEVRQFGIDLPFKFDWSELYRYCKTKDGIPGLPGTFPRTACEVVKNYGMPRESKGVFGMACSSKPLGWDKAYDIEAYYAIRESDPDETIKQALVQYGSIMMACRWGDNWLHTGDTFIDPGRRRGGHCVRIVGYDDTLVYPGWVVANSWGKIMWGKFGMAVMPYPIFRSFVLPEGDVWKLVDDLSNTLR